MGNYLWCKKEKKAVSEHSQQFMNVATDGCYGKPAVLDLIYRRAEMEGVEK